MKKRVLFYFEPMTYRGNPYHLKYWWDLFSAFADRSASCFTSQIAASPMMKNLETAAFEEIHPINQVDLLRSLNFDRTTYSRDLCYGFSFRNRPLLRALRNIKQKFSPDIVISMSENRYLRKVFGPEKVMFMELGPLPRTGLKTAIHVDPYGHQINSAVDWFARAKWDHPSMNTFADIWQRQWIAPLQEATESSGLGPWLRQASKGKKIMLAALQPIDWITYEGVSFRPALDPLSVLRRLADKIGSEWVILPQWHVADTCPSNDLMDEVVQAQPNILHVPPEFRTAKSDLLLPLIDGVATISSNVAAAGAILGKELTILGRSKFYKLGAATPAARYDFLAFLACRYCRVLDDFLYQDGAFADHILRLRHNPRWLFEPAGIKASQLEDFLSPRSELQ
ncbi:MAG: hypothetical protein LBV36_03060 [Chromatiales bacterium]|nr:hypothetical protein [Chromatiales bacterium]